MSDHEKQFSYDETLLREGQYGEWFWAGLNHVSVEFLKAPVRVPEPPKAELPYKNQEFPQPKRWRDKAACAGADPVVFFGKEGTDLRKQYMNPRAKWRKLCPQCPVQDLCIELARESVSEGIFGGKLFQLHQATTAGVQESHRTLHEYDEETLPRRGRPRKTKLPMNMSAKERDRFWKEMQKEINDRISAARTHESQCDQ